jgi:hypothetical protein
MRWSAFLFISGAYAETLMGKVIKIADGDADHPGRRQAGTQDQARRH